MNIISLLIFIAISFSTFFLFFLISKEKIEKSISKREIILPIIIGVLGSFKLSIRPETVTLLTILLSLFLGYLIFNTFTDEKSSNLYVFPYYFMLPIGIYILFNFYDHSISYFLFYFILYFFLQKVVFSRMYASGDSRMFILCALYLTANIQGSASNEMPILLFMLHMTAAIFVFIFYNIFRKNITKKLTLKTPMPFAFAIALGYILIF